MKKNNLFLFLLFFCFSQKLWADGLDYSADGGFQTYPLGSLFSAQAGYGAKIWQAPESGPADFWKYGYVRPQIKVDSIFLINRITAELEFYPISLLGFSAGGGVSQRDVQKYKDFDCDALRCRGELTYELIRANLTLGYADFFFNARGTYQKFHSASRTQAFYDEMSYLVGQAGGDDQRSLQILGGQKISDKWSALVAGSFQEFIHTRNNNAAVLALVNYTEGPWRASFGLGEYRSTHQVANPVAAFVIHWSGPKSLALF